MINEVLAGRPVGGTERHGQILVVDDSKLIRTMVGGMLRRVGYTVCEAEDGAQALALLARRSFDVVITDLNMPEVDGFQVLEAVKASAPQTEVIVFTGALARDVGAAVRALRLGAHDFLTKPPAGPHEVIITVDRALEKKRLHEANLRLLQEMEGLSRFQETLKVTAAAGDDSALQGSQRGGRYRALATAPSLELMEAVH